MAVGEKNGRNYVGVLKKKKKKDDKIKKKKEINYSFMRVEVINNRRLLLITYSNDVVYNHIRKNIAVIYTYIYMCITRWYGK